MQTDTCMQNWLYGSVANDNLDLAMEPDQDSFMLWVAIEDLF
jgi:hypothetical protein